ncbi:MAG: radical SAM protein [Thermoplasmatota archaeon]
MLLTLLDGYVDEPSCLGVPPYISPYVRYAAGAIVDAGHRCQYRTVDQWRQGASLDGSALLIITGALVPGRYLRGMPMSYNEFHRITASFNGPVILGGSSAKHGIGHGGGRAPRRVHDLVDYTAEKDADAFIYDLLHDTLRQRHRTKKEWQRWALAGADVVTRHPDFPDTLLAEIETYRGCPRYLTGGCSFCMEPLHGRPETRPADDIVEETVRLYELGVRHFRLGCQSCFYSYSSRDIGTRETPRPNVAAIRRLLTGIRTLAPNIEVLHIDNANPAVVATYPDEAAEITRLITRLCTAGNTVALGMETADERVRTANHINATPGQTLAAIRLINDLGARRGENGMPRLLPGINFLYGLLGESSETFQKNRVFLRTVMQEQLLLRRINIRQVVPVRSQQAGTDTAALQAFKQEVNESVNRPMLRRITPRGTVLKDVYLEIHRGKNTFGRQIGSYPLLVCLPYREETGHFVDVKITGHGYRSITGIAYPLDINTASLDALTALPEVGEKRAARIITGRPYADMSELAAVMDPGFDTAALSGWCRLG